MQVPLRTFQKVEYGKCAMMCYNYGSSLREDRGWVTWFQVEIKVFKNNGSDYHLKCLLQFFRFILLLHCHYLFRAEILHAGLHDYLFCDSLRKAYFMFLDKCLFLHLPRDKLNVCFALTDVCLTSRLNNSAGLLQQTDISILIHAQLPPVSFFVDLGSLLLST